MMKLLQWLLRSLCSCSPFCILWNLNWPLDPVFCDATSPASSSHFLVDLGRSGRAWCTEAHFALLELCSHLRWPQDATFSVLSPSPFKKWSGNLGTFPSPGLGLCFVFTCSNALFIILFTELVSVHFTSVWENSWPKSDRYEGSLICQM